MKNVDRIHKLREWSEDNEPNFDHLNSALVDWAEKELGFKVDVLPYGANRCPALNRLFSWGYKNGYLNRGRVGIHGGRSLGFPAWVYTYSFRW